MRCLTLARALGEHGLAASFVMREHAGHLASLVEAQGFAVTLLPVAVNGHDVNGTSHASWLGASWEQDANDTVQALGPDPVEWLVVDHYAIDRRWEARLRSRVRRILVIDDLADRPHDCDLLLDQNLVASPWNRYRSRVAEGCAVLLGPAYALLQPEYAALHERAVPREGAVRRVLISFGGADEDDLTARALEALLSVGGPDVGIDVVVGPSNAHLAELRAKGAEHARVSIHHGLTSLAGLLMHADVAIGGAGSTSWERLCLGVPSIMVAQAENQRAIAEALSEQKLAIWIGDEKSATTARFAEALGDLIEHGLSAEWSRRCLATVDGRGTERVCAALTGTDSTQLRARPASFDDEALLLEWANDPVTRGNAFTEGTITSAEHHAWLENRLADADGCRLFIVETSEGVPIGQVRFDRLPGGWRLSYALAPAFRGRRLGRPLLEVAMGALASCEPAGTLFAEVKPANAPSQRVLQSLGFAERRVGDVIEYRRALGAT